MNIDFVTLVAAQERTRQVSQEALPDAPVLADFLPERKARLGRIRAGLSVRLHTMADRIAPAPPIGEPAGIVRSIDPQGC
jgi:hypothetical protein